MQIKLKDGTVKEYGQAISVYDIAKDISDGLARAALRSRLSPSLMRGLRYY